MSRQPDHIVEIMRDEHKRDIEGSPQLVDLILQTPAYCTIDCGKWLIEEQHGRFAREGTGECHPLALTA